jgi:hypothetical protein
MFELALSLPGTTEISYGSSKLFQILMPLMAYILLQEIPGLRPLTHRVVRFFRPQANPGQCDHLVNMLLGFFSWKIGCDLGFLLISTSAAPWSIAFTVSGLIPYTIAQYFIYYLIGHKIILQGKTNPFKDDFEVKQIRERPAIWKQFISKFFHENMNVTSAHVPLRQVFLKPFVDYGGLITSWPLYNVGLLFFQSGEVNFAPMVHFIFLNIFVFYVVNVMGYILGYNLGEFIYFRVIHLLEWLKKQMRLSQLFSQKNALKQVFESQRNPLIRQTETLNATVLPQVQTTLNRYGINPRWLLSATMGVIFVILLEPNLAGSIFSTADRIQHLLFYSLGHLDTDHLQQFLSASAAGELPAPDLLIDQFSDQLNSLYAAAYDNQVRISLSSP